jgi:hypothetical protein
MKGGTGGAPVERALESARGMDANLEVVVEGQLGCVTRACDMQLSQHSRYSTSWIRKRTYQPSEARPLRRFRSRLG